MSIESSGPDATKWHGLSSVKSNHLTYGPAIANTFPTEVEKGDTKRPLKWFPSTTKQPATNADDSHKKWNINREDIPLGACLRGGCGEKTIEFTSTMEMVHTDFEQMEKSIYSMVLKKRFGVDANSVNIIFVSSIDGASRSPPSGPKILTRITVHESALKDTINTLESGVFSVDLLGRTVVVSVAGVRMIEPIHVVKQDESEILSEFTDMFPWHF